MLTVGTSNTSHKATARARRNPKSQKSVKATTVNKSKRPGVQPHLHNHQVSSQVNNTITEIGCDDKGLDFLAGRQQETSTHCELAGRKYVGDLRSG